MNVHILVNEVAGDGIGYDVKVFSSRDAMVSERTKDGRKGVMFPPVEIPRNVQGILEMGRLINRIHTEGPYEVLQSMEVESNDL